MSLENLYQQLLYNIEHPFIAETSIEDSDTVTSTKEAGVDIGVDIIKAGIKNATSKSKTEGSQKKYTFPTRQYNVDSIASILKEKNKTVVFENYHRLNSETFRQLCIDLRTLSDNLINTLFVGIPNDPYKIIENNSELELRIQFLPFTFWNQADLKRIALGGQEILRLQKGFVD